MGKLKGKAEENKCVYSDGGSGEYCDVANQDMPSGCSGSPEYFCDAYSRGCDEYTTTDEYEKEYAHRVENGEIDEDDEYDAKYAWRNKDL